MKKRIISEAIMKDMKGYPVLGILGPRQSGKTTLAKELFPNMLYTNLEDLTQQDFALKDPKGFLERNKNGMIIDEFQRVPNLLSYIQTIVDERNKPGLFVLTGSQNFLMMEKISQSLAGRISLFNLLPFSISELYTDKRKVPDLDRLLFKGFFPRLYSATLDPVRYYQNYVQTYIERDVRQIKNISDLTSFQNFLRLCAGRAGQIVNYSSLSDDVGVSHNTIKAWLNLLQTSYIIHTLPPYFRNYKKQIIKSPKIYFNDTGLLCFLLGIDREESISSHYLRGGIFENLIVNEIFKHGFNFGKRLNLYFWRDKRGKEIDLLLDFQKSRVAIEIKAGKTITGDFFKNLGYYGELDTLCPPANRYIIYGGTDDQERKDAAVRSWLSLLSIDKSFGLNIEHL
jgi:uncharacterized protein